MRNPFQLYVTQNDSTNYYTIIGNSNMHKCYNRSLQVFSFNVCSKKYSQLNIKNRKFIIQKEILKNIQKEKKKLLNKTTCQKIIYKNLIN